MPYSHSISVRYGEVDMQRVVFNAHYLAYCDDAFDSWLRQLDLHYEAYGWDAMLKKATLEWQAGATIGDRLDIEVGVQRWGNTSFDIGFAGTVRGAPVFTAVITYVGVVHGTRTPAPPPPEVRQLLGEPVASH